MSTLKFNQVAIIGVGLIGGSLGMILKRKSLANRIVGFSLHQPDLHTGIKLGAIDSFVTDPRDAVHGADLVILAIPVGSYEASLRSWSASLSDDAIVTDVGSVKGSLVARAEAMLPRYAHFVGAHPIAGKEASGPAAASDTLFRGARCIMTPTSATNPAALAQVEQLWLQVRSPTRSAYKISAANSSARDIYVTRPHVLVAW
jgi:prephenate dehydrogenase